MTDCEETGHFSKTFLAFHLLFAFASATAIALAPVEPVGGLPVRIAVVLFMTAAALYAAWNLKKGYFRHFMVSQGALILIFVISVWGVFAPSVSSKFTSKVIAEDFAVMEKDPAIPIYIDTFYRPSVAFYTGIYGKALPEFDLRKKAVDDKNEEKGVLLPGKDEETLPDTAYILVQKKILKNWPESEKKNLYLLWEKDTACVFLKQEVAI
jgi:hypothetical protein